MNGARGVRLTAIPAILLISLAPAGAWRDAGDLGPIKQAVAAGYASLVHASYEDALTGARGLATAVDAFLAAPTAGSLQAARQAWIDARVPYAQTAPIAFTMARSMPSTASSTPGRSTRT
jgi:putative iron-regulated protein